MISREEIFRQERMNGGQRNVQLRRLFNEQRAARIAEQQVPVTGGKRVMPKQILRTICLTCSHARRKEGQRLAKKDMVKVTIQNPKIETKQVKARGGGTRTMRRAYGTCSKGHKVSLILKSGRKTKSPKKRTLKTTTSARHKKR